MPKRTYQPSKVRRVKKMGFRKKIQTRAGRTVLKKRRRKDRKRLTP